MAKKTTYQAQNMNEALLKVKMDLGNDAVIEDKRKIRRGGFLGFFQETLVEVDAKLPETKGGLKNNSAPANGSDTRSSGGKKNTERTWELDEPASPDFSPREHAARLIDQKGQNNNASTYSRPSPGKTKSKKMTNTTNKSKKSSPVATAPQREKNNQIDTETRDKLSRVIENTDLLSEKVDELSDRLEKKETTETTPNFPGRLDEIHQRLCKNGVREEHIRDVIRRIRKRTSPENIDNLDFLLDRLEEVVGEDFKKHPPLNTVDEDPVLVPFVGPTGVGKTTTLAKLAAYFFSMEQESVGFITMDHYRLMAVEQLASYADILQVPLIDVSEEQGDFADAVDKMADKQVDMIFVDTAGRSQYNQERVEHLESLKKSDYRVIPHLVLSATSCFSDVKSVLEGFSSVDYERLVVTKLDETRQHGILYNLLQETDLPIAYLTDGQGVPDDLEMAEPDRVTQLIAEVDQ
ncbi:MAG: flagellar biosynthesis protein FlhF [bacterium]